MNPSATANSVPLARSQNSTAHIHDLITPNHPPPNLICSQTLRAGSVSNPEKILRWKPGFLAALEMTNPAVV